MGTRFRIDDANRLIGTEVGLSEWMNVSQALIDGFAEVTGDHQWIHTAGAKANAGPFGGPIAHGLLLLSLTVKMAQDSGALPGDAASITIYGYDKIRFQAPVRSGKRVRCRTTLLDSKNLRGRTVLKVRLQVEVEDGDLPAMVADCLLLVTK